MIKVLFQNLPFDNMKQEVKAKNNVFRIYNSKIYPNYIYSYQGSFVFVVQ